MVTFTPVSGTFIPANIEVWSTYVTFITTWKPCVKGAPRTGQVWSRGDL